VPEIGNSSYPSKDPAEVKQFIESYSYGLNIRGLSAQGEDAHPILWSNISGLPLATPDHSSAVDPPDGKSHFPDIMTAPRHHQIQLHEAYRLFGDALAATGTYITSH
jgi:hypothetical protein